MSDPKKTPAFARAASPAVCGDYSEDGMTQYAYVAMTFHAADIARHSRMDGTVQAAFDRADLFFAELAKRTK